jgi:hypothetical protein
VTEAGGLCGELEANMGYTARLCLKTKQNSGKVLENMTGDENLGLFTAISSFYNYDQVISS